jgi:hypothetical protein
MTTTSEIISPERQARLAPPHLVGGIGGLVFAATVIAQNIIRGFHGPARDASATTVIHFYATHRTTTLVLAALFPLGAAGLAAFLGALGSRLGTSRSRVPALAGILGAAGIFATFTMMIATETALAGYIHRGSPDPGVVSALWVTHNAVFGVLLVSIAVALAGLSTAASTSGLVARIWKPAGAAGAIALLITGAATPALVDGSGIIGLGLIGFLGWIAFVTAAAIALLRRPSANDSR